jgi:hypothetical protein
MTRSHTKSRVQLHATYSTKASPISSPTTSHAKARPCNHEPDRLYKRKFPLHVLFALRPFMLRYDVAWTSGGIAGLVGKVELAFRFSPLLGIFTSKIIGES